MNMPTSEQRQMARLLYQPPDKPDTWPMELIDQLIRLEKREGKDALQKEIQRLLIGRTVE